MNSFKIFNESKLPDKSKFCNINEKEYERAINIWKLFKIKISGAYHDLYLKTDVLLLCNSFERFIKACLHYYSLDPCHYFSSPGLSSDAMLKMTKIKLELISDIDMHLFIEKGMRGGISYTSKRYSKFDEYKCIIYWDANNLYGWALINLYPVVILNF